MGIIGFCKGGRMAMLFGARSREIDAVVPFHPAPMKDAAFGWFVEDEVTGPK